jgi:hypothetical protein
MHFSASSQFRNYEEIVDEKIGKNDYMPRPFSDPNDYK